ncbi:protein kinase domain-containing protein [Rhodopirellula islandica]|nr:protein kinase [Rhodopirellula islandica]
MASDDCPPAEKLSDYASGTLSEDLSLDISNHVEACPECEDTLISLESNADTLIGKIRLPQPEDSYAKEAGHERAIELVQAIRLESPSDEDATFPPDTATVQSEPNAEIPAQMTGRLAQYVLLEKLGQGGMGAVYRAKHTRLRRMVALKVLPPNLLKNASAVARFDREMHAVGQLDHPNIVRASDAGEFEGIHYLVMELVDGDDVAVIASRHGPLPTADACEIIRQAAVGLSHANDNGLVHRDIKPSNLMLTQSGQVKLLDMGLALLETPLDADDGLTSAGQVMGTLDYIAPEQVTNSHAVDIRADIYSLGCTLYRLLCGHAPFQDAKYQNAIYKAMAHVDTTPPPLAKQRAGLPAGLIAIVDKMLAKSPDDRFQTPDELAAALAPLTAGHDLQSLLVDPSADAASPSFFAGAADAETATTSFVSLAGQPNTNEPSASKTVAKPVLQTGSSMSGGRRVWPLVAGLGGAAMMLFAAGVFFLLTPQGMLRVEINDPDIEVRVKGDRIVLHRDDKDPISMAAGEHTLTVTQGDLSFDTKQFTLKRGETTTVKVELMDGVLQATTSDGSMLGQKQTRVPTPARKPLPKSTSPALASGTEQPTTSPLNEDIRWAHEELRAVITLRSETGHDSTIGPGQPLPEPPGKLIGLTLTKQRPATDLDMRRVGSLTDLESFHFGSTTKSSPTFIGTAQGMLELGRLSKLRSLDLGVLREGAGGEKVLANLALEYLHLPYAGVNEWAAAAAGHPTITRLSCYRAHISDAALKGLEQGQRLKMLDLGDSPVASPAAIEHFTAAVPGCSIRLPNFEVIDPRGNQFGSVRRNVSWKQAIGGEPRMSPPLPTAVTDSGKSPTPEEDIRWAHEVLKAGITLRSDTGKESTVTPEQPLPENPGTLVGITLAGQKSATDLDLQRVAGFADLETLVFAHSPNSSPNFVGSHQGILELARLPKLRSLSVHYLPGVGGEEVLKDLRLDSLSLPWADVNEWAAAAAGHPTLTTISAYGTQLSDAALKGLDENKGLKLLDLSGAGSLSPEAIQHFADSVPGCRIRLSKSEFIEPREKESGAVNRNVSSTETIGGEPRMSPALPTAVKDSGKSPTPEEDIRWAHDVLKAIITLRRDTGSMSTITADEPLPEDPGTLVGIKLTPLRTATDSDLQRIGSFTDLESFSTGKALTGAPTIQGTAQGILELGRLPNLRTLDLHSWTGLGGKELLENLQISSLRLPSDRVNEWAAAAVGHPTITSLSAFVTHLTDTSLMNLEQNSALKHIDLRYNPKLTRAAVNHFAAALPGCQIQLPDYDSLEARERMWAGLAPREGSTDGATPVQNDEGETGGFSPTPGEDIHWAIHELKAVVTLRSEIGTIATVILGQPLPKLPSMVVAIEFSERTVATDNDLRRVASFSHLESLSFGYRDSEGAKYIGSDRGILELARLQHLQVLNVHAVPEVGGQEILRKLHLEHLYLPHEGTDAWATAVAGHPTFTSLNAFRTGLSDEALKGLEQNKGLKVLNVSGAANLSPEAIQHFAEAVPACRIKLDHLQFIEPRHTEPTLQE